MIALSSNIIAALLTFALSVSVANAQVQPQMKPDVPMRIAAVQESDIIRVSTLSNISSEALGLLDSDEGGFGSEMWQGTERSLVELLLPKVPVESPSEAVRDLAFRLLATSALPPKGKVIRNLLEIRLDRLSALDEKEAFIHLIRLVPEKLTSELSAKQYVQLLFDEGNIKDGCAQVQGGYDQYQPIFWHHALILCHAIDKERDRVDFYSNLLREEGNPPTPEFVGLVENILGQRSVKSQEASKWISTVMKQSEKTLDTSKNKKDPSPFDYMATVTKKETNPLWSPRKMEKWWLGKKGLADQQKADIVMKLYTLLDLFDGNISEKEWQKFYYLEADSIPKSVLSMALQEAADQKKIGETVLFALLTLGDKPVSKLDFQALKAVIESLQEVGLEKEAKAIAKEAL